MIKHSMLMLIVALVATSCATTKMDSTNEVVRLIVAPPNSDEYNYHISSLTIYPNGMVSREFSNAPGYGINLPPGSVDFVDLCEKLKLLVVDYKVEGGSQVGFDLGQTTTVCSYISDDQVLRDLFPRDPDSWKIIWPEAEFTATGEINIVDYDIQPLSKELRTLFLEQPIYPNKNIEN